MAYYNNLEALVAQLKKDANSILNNEVAEIAKSVLVTEVDNTVYSVYNPKMYNRRSDNGGLGDENNISITSVSDTEIFLHNETQVNDNYGGVTEGYLDEIIVSGSGYVYGNGTEAYNQPRDFYQAASDDLDNGILQKTVDKALKAKGYQTY